MRIGTNYFESPFELSELNLGRPLRRVADPREIPEPKIFHQSPLHRLDRFVHLVRSVRMFTIDRAGRAPAGVSMSFATATVTS